jgi:hypothetical protein
MMKKMKKRVGKVNEAASLLGKQSAKVRRKKWGAKAFARKMRKWGALGGRPRGSKGRRREGGR